MIDNSAIFKLSYGLFVLFARNNDKDNAGLVSMLRDGTVSTALTFERGKRHHCIYNTPIMPFEICVRTLKVENNILDNGKLALDYIIEIRGAKAERTKFELEVIKM